MTNFSAGFTNEARREGTRQWRAFLGLDVVVANPTATESAPIRHFTTGKECCARGTQIGGAYEQLILRQQCGTKAHRLEFEEKEGRHF